MLARSEQNTCAMKGEKDPRARGKREQEAWEKKGQRVGYQN